MNPVIVSIDDRLSNPGDTIMLPGHIDQGSYSVGEHDFTLPQGIDYDLALTNAGEGILVTGMLSCHVEGTCDRCLEPACFDINGEVDGYYLYELPSPDEQGVDEDDVDFSLISADQTIDLADALTGALIMETPYVVLCQPDCLGLCPHCGANLNEGDCGCQKARENEPDPMNPFSALKDIKIDE